MASIPAPVRATLGLLVTALDTVQELVERAPEIPMEAVGNSMQLSLRLQQHYVALINRGDEFIAGLRGAPEETPAWATFDEEPATGPEHAGPQEGGDLPDAVRQDEPRQAGQGDPLLAAATAERADAPPPATRSPDATAGKAAKTGKTTKIAPVTESPAEKRAVRKAPARKAAQPRKAAAPVTTAATTAPAKKAVSTKRATSSAKATSPRQTARKAGARSAPVTTPAPAATANAPLQLDADLDDGGVSARPVSAFDLVDTAPQLDSPAADPTQSPAEPA